MKTWVNTIPYLFWGTLLANGLALSGKAQQSDTLLLREFEPLEVTASRIEGEDLNLPFSLSVIKKSQVSEGLPLIAADELLNYQPGILALNPTNFAQDLRISIRGFGARSAFGIRGIKIIVDGLPETTPDGQSQVDNLALGIIDEIEVIRGPASGLFGNASGGVININTEEAPDRFFAEARTLLGSFDLQQYQVKAGQSLGKFSYIIHGNHTKLNGFRRHSRVENNLMNGKFGYRLGKGSNLKFIVNHVNSPVAKDPGGVDIETALGDRRAPRDRNVEFDAGEQLHQTKVGLVYNGQFGENHRIIANTFYLTRTFANKLPFSFGGIVEIDRGFSGLGFSYQFNGKIGAADYRLKVGADYENQVDDRRRYNNNEGEQGQLVFDQEERFSSLGLYLLQNISLDKLFVHFGLRWDDLDLEARDNFFSDGDDSGQSGLDNLNPLFGITYKVSDALRVYGNYSSSFETPTLSELSANPSGRGGFNPSLRPQEANNYEVGIKGRLGKRLKYSATYFCINLENELVPFELEAFPGRTFFRNAGQSTRKGVELFANLLIAKGLVGTLSYTYSDFQYKNFEIAGVDLDGNFLPGIPKQLLTSAVRYVNKSGWYSTLQARFVGDIFLNDTNTSQDDSYLIINLRLGHRINIDNWRLTPFFGVNNLLDTNYNSNIRINAFGDRFFEPGPGVNIFGGVKVRFWKKK